MYRIPFIALPLLTIKRNIHLSYVWVTQFQDFRTEIFLLLFSIPNLVKHLIIQIIYLPLSVKIYTVGIKVYPQQIVL